MNTWNNNGYTIEEVAFDGDLHAFEVYNADDELLGTIYPASIEDMNSCIAALDAGKDPVTDGWEDGNGNVCTVNGWGC